MFTMTTIIFRKNVFKNLKYAIRFKSVKYYENIEDEHGTHHKVNCPDQIQVPKFKFPVYQFKPPSEIPEKVQANEKIERNIEESEESEVASKIDVNKIEQKRLKKNKESLLISNLDINQDEMLKKEQDVLMIDVPNDNANQNRAIESVKRAKNKVILIPMFLVFCALVDFAMDCYSV